MFKGLTKEEKSWVLYDVGNSAFTMLACSLIPIWFKELAIGTGRGQIDADTATGVYATSIAIVTVIVALIGPVCGAIADHKDRKKIFFTTAVALGVAGCIINGSQLYFTVGDVSGKGVPASLFMAQVTRLFSTMAHQGLDPAAICNRMNSELSGEDNVNGMFVTMFVGMLDMQTGHLSFCNAGHNPPVIGGGKHQGDFLKMIPNVPIGLWPDYEFKGEEMDSVKGRALFIYTDGLNEAENPEQERFGDKRLLDILRDTNFDTARQVVEALEAEVAQHRNGAEPNDDMTMLCLRVQ